MSLRRASKMKLDNFKPFKESAPTDAMDEKSIDFSSVGLYLGGLQVVFAVVCCALTSVLACWLPLDVISAVRTLALTTVVGGFLVRSPLIIGRVRGVQTVFNGLRPCVAVYVGALVIEQLLHTCVTMTREGCGGGGGGGVGDDGFDMAVAQKILYHTVTATLTIAGFLRASNPRSESDVSFLMTAGCLAVAALVPPPAISRTGPLCSPATFGAAGERVLRSLLFSGVYSVLVYAAAPARNSSNELFVCVARATAASVWMLAAPSWTLFLAPVQGAIILVSRLKNLEADNVPLTYEHLPLSTHVQPHAPSENSDLENSNEFQDADVKSMLASRAVGLPPALSGGGGGLSFSFSNGGPGRSTANGLNGTMAAAATREANL